MKARVLVASLVASLAPACTPPVGPRQTEASIGGDVIASVDGTSISRREVELRARARGTSAREALDSLEAEALLGAAARSRGLQPGNLDTRRKQVLAQMVLRAIENEHSASSVGEDAIAARVPAVAASLRRPERRQVVHLLVRSEASDANLDRRAESLATHAIALAGAESLGEATLERVENRLRQENPATDVVVERLGALEADAAIERPFLDAVFAASSTGVLSRPLRTRFGWHVIQLVRIDPAYTPTEAEIRERATAAALDAERAAAVDTVLVAARDRTTIEVHQSTVRRLLADDALFRGVR